MEQITDKLWSWASILEWETQEQARKASTMAFVYPRAVILPDAHLGKGACVGFGYPTLEAICPATVGVDIGCFHGDTLIPLLNGTKRTLQQLTSEGGFHWVYSLDSERNIVPGKATALKTRIDAQLMKITVSGGDEIVCTPDHEFMLLDGTYRQAKDLRIRDGLMPLYRQWDEGYESVKSAKGRRYQQTSKLVYEAIYGPMFQKSLIHHNNHIPWDNRPENLLNMTASQHRSLHNASPEFQARRLEGIRKANQDPARQAQMAEVGARNWQTYMHDKADHFREAIADNGQRGASYLIHYNKSPASCNECDHVAKNPASLRWHKKREHEHNHVVIAVEHLNERADVYCLQVEEHHNFALAADVFVHNCGMQATRTQFTLAHVDGITDDKPLSKLREAIEKAVPLSAGNYNQEWWHGNTRQRVAQLEAFPGADHAEKIAPNWRLQLGSLGSGNHFIECSTDEENRIWLFLHSGSRGVGNKLAQKHIKAAQVACKGIDLPHPDLAYLTEGTPEFGEYITDLHWAQGFALLNREEMMDRIISCFSGWIGTEVFVEETIQCHHNYTVQEEIDGKMVWMSRKGAIDAHAGVRGLIPGSMGAASYIVTGKENTDALNTAPHGAGRLYSRSKAKQRFTIEGLEKKMEGIEWRHSTAFLDEDPGAYKDIDQVMEDAADLISIDHTLRQFLNVKGD